MATRWRWQPQEININIQHILGGFFFMAVRMLRNLHIKRSINRSDRHTEQEIIVFPPIIDKYQTGYWFFQVSNIQTQITLTDTLSTQTVLQGGIVTPPMPGTPQSLKSAPPPPLYYLYCPVYITLSLTSTLNDEKHPGHFFRLWGAPGDDGSCCKEGRRGWGAAHTAGHNQYLF